MRKLYRMSFARRRMLWDVAAPVVCHFVNAFVPKGEPTLSPSKIHPYRKKTDGIPINEKNIDMLKVFVPKRKRRRKGGDDVREDTEPRVGDSE